MSVFILGGYMKTENLYFVTLSMILDKECMLCVKTSPYKRILVIKKGNYPNEIYSDIKTGRNYTAKNEELDVGDIFIDTLVSFNYITGNQNKDLQKQKILSIYNSIKR